MTPSFYFHPFIFPLLFDSLGYTQTVAELERMGVGWFNVIQNSVSSEVSQITICQEFAPFEVDLFLLDFQCNGETNFDRLTSEKIWL